MKELRHKYATSYNRRLTPVPAASVSAITANCNRKKDPSFPKDFPAASSGTMLLSLKEPLFELIPEIKPSHLPFREATWDKACA